MFGTAKKDGSAKRTVGQDLAQVLPNASGAWYEQSYLVGLNVLLIHAALLSAANGYVFLSS